MNSNVKQLDLLQSLIDKFSKDIAYYKNSAKYNEHNCRNEFIDPFLRILGWDIENKQSKAPQYREVITENYQKETGRPDYSMTLNGIVKFHIEAKKPGVNICELKEPCVQARRYGWSSKLRLTALTNFEYLYIYDTTIMPCENDMPNIAAVKKYHYKEYCDKFDEIYSILSRDTLYLGRFDENLEKHCFNSEQKGLHLPIDEYFLRSINNWRKELGIYLYEKNGYSLDVINDYTQEFINQIIFIRICEDRRLPLYHSLKEVLNEKDLIAELIKLFKEADKKYNSGLFNDNEIAFDLNNKIIRNIIEELYYPKSPYEFDMIRPHILGQIYEMFLTEQLVLKDSKIELESKNKRLNRDIVTTPIEIVRYMVEKTLGDVLKNKTPKEILEYKIIDIACGSGIYLVEAYEYIIGYVTQWYINNDESHLINTERNMHKLPFEEKKQILLNCIFGIDIDNHAVEVAKLNLSLKLLEDETEPTLFDVEGVLPNLSNNIMYGNSLVDFKNINYKKLSEIEKEKIVPFNWEKINGGKLFDVVIGNPPYVNTEDMNNLLVKKEVEVYKKKYKTGKGQFDKYFIFIERALEKVKDGGTVCYIIPNKFTKIKAGETLRELLGKNKLIKEYIDFGSCQLFDSKTIYSAIVTLEKKTQRTLNFVEVDNVKCWFAKQNVKEYCIDSQILNELPWALVADEKEMNLISDIYRNTVPLEKEAIIFNGVQTSAEQPPIYWFREEDIIAETDKCLKISRDNKEFIVEKNILRRYFKPIRKNEKNLGTYDSCTTDKYIIFPYNEDGELLDIYTMQKEYPNTLAYFEQNYLRLVPKQVDARGKRDVPLANKDTWYQYGRDQALTAFQNRPKLIVGVLSKKAMYLYDNQDFVIASGGTAGYCAISHKHDSKYELEYIQAYLNHPITEKLLSIIGSDFEGGFYSRGTNVLAHIPFKIIDFNNPLQNKWYNEVVENTRRIYEINSKFQNDVLSKKVRETLNVEKEYLIQQINEIISKIYEL